MSNTATTSELRLTACDGMSTAQAAALNEQATQLASSQQSTGQGLSASDPRWVLAMQTYDQLEGDILAPDKREKLIHMGRTFGLSVFEANLVIAIVQDRARRGQTPHSAQTTLSMIRAPKNGNKYRRTWKIALCCSAVIVFEFALVYWWLS